MYQHSREIRWANPALDYFIHQLAATLDDIDAVNAVLVYVRDHPQDTIARRKANKEAHAVLRYLSGELYLSNDRYLARLLQLAS